MSQLVTLFLSIIIVKETNILIVLQNRRFYKHVWHFPILFQCKITRTRLDAAVLSCMFATKNIIFMDSSMFYVVCFSHFTNLRHELSSYVKSQICKIRNGL